MKMVRILATKEDLAKINIYVYFLEILLPKVFMRQLDEMIILQVFVKLQGRVPI